MSETEPRCSTPCDDDCEAVCHEDHVPGHKKAHWPYDCPAAERYGWGGSDFIAAAVKRLREERDRVKAELDARIAAESADVAAGSYAGRAEEAEAARDAVQAEATLLRRALIGRRHFPAGVMRTPMDERTEAIRARWDEFCFSGPSETDRERDQVIGWLLDRMDSATGRAEKAEAALAEMRERHDVLGQTRAEIAIELRDAARWHPDNAAWTQDMDQAARIVEIGTDAYAAENGLPRLGAFIRASHCPWCGAPQQLDGDGLVPSHEHPVYFDECPGTHRRPADVTPRTAPERASDEQGEREGHGPNAFGGRCRNDTSGNSRA